MRASIHGSVMTVMYWVPSSRRTSMACCRPQAMNVYLKVVRYPTSVGYAMGRFGGGQMIELPRDSSNLIAEASLIASDSVRGHSTFRRHLRCSAASPSPGAVMRSSCSNLRGEAPQCRGLS